MAGNNSEKLTNKVVFDGTVLIDLTEDTVTRSDVLEDVWFHTSSGGMDVGAIPNKSDTTITISSKTGQISEGYYTNSIYQVSDSNLTAENIVSGKSILGVNGSAITINSDATNSRNVAIPIQEIEEDTENPAYMTVKEILNDEIYTTNIYAPIKYSSTNEYGGNTVYIYSGGIPYTDEDNTDGQ